jgi:spore coat protein H
MKWVIRLTLPENHMRRITSVAVIGLLGFVVFFATAAEKTKGNESNLKPADIFRGTNIWTVRLSLTPDQWKAMPPRQGPRPVPPPGATGFSLQGPEGGRNGMMAAFGLVFDYVHADLEFGTNVFKDVGVRYKGNGTFFSSQNTLKRSLKIDLHQFVKAQNLAGMTQLNLHNSVRDPGSMNESIAYALFNQGGVPASRTAYARVFVTVPGIYDKQYFGLYSLVQDVGREFIKEKLALKKGALFKPVTPNLFEDLGDDWKNYQQTYDPKGPRGELTTEEKERVIAFAKIVTKAYDAEFAKKLPEFLDLDNFARYMALTTWLVDMDGILGVGQNYYLYLNPKTHKFMFFPWDQDQTFGQFPRGSTAEQRENLTIHRPWSSESRFLERVFKSDEFKKLYLATLREFNSTILQPETIRAQVDQLAPVLREPIREESPERFTEFNKAVAGEMVNIPMGQAGMGGTPVKSIKGFVGPRHQSVQDQLAGKSQGETIFSGFGRPPARRPAAGQ